MKRVLSVLLIFVLLMGTITSGFAKEESVDFLADEKITLKETGSSTGADIAFNGDGSYTNNGQINYVFTPCIPYDQDDLEIEVHGETDNGDAYLKIEGSIDGVALIDYLATRSSVQMPSGEYAKYTKYAIPKTDLSEIDDFYFEVKWSDSNNQEVAHITLKVCFEPTPMNTLTVAIEGDGSTDPIVGTHDYNEGMVVNLTATPDYGWHFVEWTGDPVADANDPTTTIEMTTDASVVAVFERNEYSLNVSHTGMGSTSPDGTSYPEYEEEVGLTATPDYGWHFVGWTGDPVADANDPTTKIEITTDASVVAVFERNEYNLNVSHIGMGSTNPDGDIGYDYEETANLTATAAPGWYFDEWTGDPVANLNSASTTVQILGNTTVAAVFLPVPPGDVTLTVEVDGQGSTIPPVGDHLVTEGSVVLLFATPSSGWEFVRWDGSVASNGSANTEILMTTDATVTAVFSPKEYTLTVTHAGEGTTTPSGASLRLYGDVVNLTASPASGWMFTGWTGPVASPSSAETTVQILGDTNVHATFRPIPSDPVVLNVIHLGEGTTVPSGSSVRMEEEEVDLYAYPAPGWHFVTWRGGDGQITSWLTTQSSVIMNQSTTVAAVFEPDEIEMVYLHIDSEDHGYTVPTEGTLMYPIGATVAVAAYGDDLYWYFHDWVGTDGSEVIDGEILMDGDKWITATFSYDGPEMVELMIEIDGGGEVDTSEGFVSSSRTFAVTAGTTVYMIPDADSNWDFDEWNGPDDSDVYSEGSGEYSIFMDEDKDIVAVFDKDSPPRPPVIRHRLKISIDGNGTVDPFVGSQTYYPGTFVDVVGDPAVGWEFDGWVGPDGEDVVSGQIEMDEDKSIIARFVEAPTPPPIEPPEIIIPLTETPLSDGDLPDTGQAFPIESLGFGILLMTAGTLTRKKDEK